MGFLETGLPMEAYLPELKSLLRASSRLIITAEPGAGKTTLVPLALFEEPWLQGKKILMLEPRRVAAAGAATRMAGLLGEDVGQTVGYRVALDTRVSARTRIEVVTEGILSRLIQSDPGLEGVGCVILDEFHERTVHGDLALALTLEVQRSLRDDLRLVIMSATLDSQGLSAFLDGASVLHAPGRVFPVETANYPVPEGKDILTWAGVQIHDLVRSLDGDLLVFLPGQGEIRRLENDLILPGDWEIHTLMGSMDIGDQKKLLGPAPEGKKRVILATNVAETSLTIPGVKGVLDLGLVRINRYDPTSGMDRLGTEPLSQASADQRRGRAGRLSGGICRRLWSQNLRLENFTPPEILRADLTALVLESALWGSSRADGLPWFSPPPRGPWSQAVALLKELGALDEKGHITNQGRLMASLGMHPRLAHMVLMAKEAGWGQLALKCSALLSEPRGGKESPEFGSRVDGFETWARGRELLKKWKTQLGLSAEDIGPGRPVGLILAWAFPDRVGIRMRDEASRDGLPKASFQTVAGRAVVITGALSREEFLVFPEVDAGQGAAKAWSAAPVTKAELEKFFSDRWVETERFFWDDWTARSESGLYWGQLCLKKSNKRSQDYERSLEMAVRERITDGGIKVLPWSESAIKWLLRIRLAWKYWSRLSRVTGDKWSDEALTSELEWLMPHINKGSGPVISHALVLEVLKQRLDYKLQKALEEDVPTHFKVPSGTIRPLVYEEGKPPILEVRIQEIFGLAQSPTVAGSPLLLHLLSPSQRPLQVTQDLASFWKTTYPEIRKEMRGRYPKHYWPENPLEAEPTARAKPRPTR